MNTDRELKRKRKNLNMTESAFGGFAAEISPDSILLPSGGVFELRFNCAQNGALALTKDALLVSEGEIAIFHTEDYYGPLGASPVPHEWTRILFVPSAQLVKDCKNRIPSNTICDAFLKNETRDNLKRAIPVAMREFNKPFGHLMAQFEARARSTVKQKAGGKPGETESVSYTAFEWKFRERDKAEAAQLDAIANFLSVMQPSDLRSSKSASLVRLDGLDLDDLMKLTGRSPQKEEMVALPPLNRPELPAAS